MNKHTVYGLPGVYNTSPITLADGYGSALAVDEQGRLILSDDVSLPISITPATGFTSAKVSITTTPTELTFTGTTKAISIKTLSTNTASIYIGPATVDSSGTNAITEITADGFFYIELNDASAPLYAVAATGTQTIFKAALT